jgi:type I restriction enzyme, R subunit
MYLDAKSSKKISDFENKSLVDLILHVSEPAEPYGNKRSQEAVAETIENNVRKVIIEESQTNPKYYEKMSKLLDELIKKRKEETIAYQEYLEKIKQLAGNVSNPMGTTQYPTTLNSPEKRALFDNLNEDEILALALDNVIKSNKLDGWRDGGLKEKKLRIAINEIIKDDNKTDELMLIVKAQKDY